jgi:hypothetical protein
MTINRTEHLAKAFPPLRVSFDPDSKPRLMRSV